MAHNEQGRGWREPRKEGNHHRKTKARRLQLEFFDRLGEHSKPVESASEELETEAWHPHRRGHKSRER